MNLNSLGLCLIKCRSLLSIVSWTAIIDAYSRTNQHWEAVALFWRRVVDDLIVPTRITLLAIFSAVSVLWALKICQKRRFNASDITIANFLLDCYAKCGCKESALRFLLGDTSPKEEFWCHGRP